MCVEAIVILAKQ